MRHHREESSGRPDRYDRGAGQRRPSDRDRATREMNRTERPSSYRQTPDRDRGPANDAAAQRNVAHRNDQSSGSAATPAASTARTSATVTPAEVTEDNGFAALGLHADLVAALARMGIVTPFPIQTATIPDALAGRDLLGRGQTGSGKTMRSEERRVGKECLL